MLVYSGDMPLRKLTLAERVRDGSFRARRDYLLLVDATRFGDPDLDELLDQADTADEPELRDLARQFAAAVRGRQRTPGELEFRRLLYAKMGDTMLEGRSRRIVELRRRWQEWNLEHGLAWRLQHGCLTPEDKAELGRLDRSLKRQLDAKREWRAAEEAYQEQLHRRKPGTSVPFPERPERPPPVDEAKLKTLLPALAKLWWKRQRRDPAEPVPDPPGYDLVGELDAAPA
jgi:hypothetical protein